MKRSINIILAIFLAHTAMAQTDIKVFNKIGPDAVLDKLYDLGFYQDVDGIDIYMSWEEYDEGVLLENSAGDYPDPLVFLANDTYDLIGFETSSCEFLFLTDYVDGGIRVGDPVAKALGVDFSQSQYGRGKQKNNCRHVRKMSSGEDVYLIFGEELYHISLTVNNGIIHSIVYIKGDEEPYANYDYSNVMF